MTQRARACLEEWGSVGAEVKVPTEGWQEMLMFAWRRTYIQKVDIYREWVYAESGYVTESGWEREVRKGTKWIY